MVKRIGTIGGRAQTARTERTITKDGLVLGAISLVSIAFGVGLYEQLGLNVVLAVTMSAAGFFVLFSLHYIIVQLSSSESMAPRISSLERVVARLARDMSQIEDLSKQVAEFRSTCERIDQAHSQLELGGFGESIHLREEATQRLSQDVRRLDAQIKSLRNYFELSNQENKDRLKSELRVIENHVKNVTESVKLQAPDRMRDFSVGLPPTLPLGNSSGLSYDTQPMPVFEPAPRESSSAFEVPNAGLPRNLMPNYFQNYETSEFEFKPLPVPNASPHNDYQMQSDFQYNDHPVPGFDSLMHADNSGSVFLPSSPVSAAQNGFFSHDNSVSDETRMLDVIQKAISGNRMDLYLQPVVSLPERNVAFYESLTRLKDESGQLIYPEQYLEIAKNKGIMPVIDNVMLFRSIQVTRKLLERGSARGLFCNLSSSSLIDKEFFPEFLNFMEKNKDLASCLFFDIDQDFYLRAGKPELEKFGSLARLGYRISMDRVTRLDLDFGKLQKQGVRFIKVDSHILLNGMEQAGARIHVADMRAYLKRYSIELIAGKIENEATLTQLLTYNLKYGQGFLFSEPRPVRPEIFKKGNSQQAA